jgi:hypothetical protein
MARFSSETRFYLFCEYRLLRDVSERFEKSLTSPAYQVRFDNMLLHEKNPNPFVSAQRALYCLFLFV